MKFGATISNYAVILNVIVMENYISLSSINYISIMEL